jgi:hypothetical protein
MAEEAIATTREHGCHTQTFVQPMRIPTGDAQVKLWSIRRAEEISSILL